VAQFSVKDIRTFAGNYKSTTVHSVIGDKWPMTRRVLAKMGMSIPNTPVVTTITTEQARAALKTLDDNLVDVTNYVRGIVPLL
jgi:hypothetical protein